MIFTSTKNIISKYLLGQAPAFASYIAVGCGPKPLNTVDEYGDYSENTSLDFEMFRVPISSRGFVNEEGVSKLVLTAELPTEERYEISEIGIYSAGANSVAGAYDSKTIFSFSQTENWQHHTSTTTTSIGSPIIEALDAPANNNVIQTTELVFQTNSDNSIFFKQTRAERYERSRFLNNMIVIRGDDSDLTTSAGHLVINSGSNHIHLTGTQVDFSKNSPTDEIKLALSIINKNGDSSSSPDNVRVLVEFSTSDTEDGEFARFEVDMTEGTGSGEYDFSNNRYFVITKQLQQLYTTPNFNWNAVSVVKIYASALVAGEPSSDYYVALDAMRLENVSTINSLYGLTGYSVIKNSDSSTIVKSPNTANYVEFRFSIGVS
jgi:hypothetical protein